MVSSGKIQQLDLLLPNQSIPVTLQNVTVLPKLNGDVNLGANFLRTHKGTLTWTTGNPVLQLQRADLQATTPILLQMSALTAPSPAPGASGPFFSLFFSLYLPIIIYDKNHHD